jgi:ABC-type phosphate transport system substrate-binding protein
MKGPAVTRRKTLASIVAATGLLAMLASQTAAQADTNVGNTTTLAAVGSDTSMDVMEGLSNVIKDAAGNPLISNYKSTPVGRTITTRTGNPNCSFTVPRGSQEGRDALSAAMRGATFTAGGTTTPVTSPDMTGCVDVARSSSGGNPTVSPGVGTMTYIPFATDSLTYATTASSSVPHKLNLNTLKAIYKANGTPGSAACNGFAPLTVADSSGTRQSWATLLGITDAPLGSGVANSWGTCVRDTNSAGTVIQEHDGRFLTAPNQILPFATAQFIAQQGGVITDIRGRASLGSIDFGATGTVNAISPVELQTVFGNGTRPLYNVVSTAALTAGSPTFDQKVVDTFVGPTSKVCQAVGTIQQYGLQINATCGDTSKKNTN